MFTMFIIKIIERDIVYPVTCAEKHTWQIRQSAWQAPGFCSSLSLILWRGRLMATL